MQDIQYIGEHLLPGARSGQAAIVASFVANLFAGISYFFATSAGTEGITKPGHGALGVFWCMAYFSIIGVILPDGQPVL